MSVKNRSEWSKKQRRLWWLKHQGLAAGIFGAIICAIVIMILTLNGASLAAILNYMLNFVVFVIKVAGVLAVLLLFAGIVIFVMEDANDESKKR